MNTEQLPGLQSPKAVPMGLAGVNPECGCVTAALSLRFATKKDIRDFYVDMAQSGREVRRMDDEVLRARWGKCPHG